MQYAYRDRKNKKRTFRALWIQRLNAAVREQGLTYSRFIDGLGKAGIEVDRKVLSELAIHEPAAFAAIVEQAKAALPAAGRLKRPERFGATESGAVAPGLRAFGASEPRAPRHHRRRRLRSARADAARADAASSARMRQGTMTDLDPLERDLLAQVEAAADEAALEAVRVAALGKKGSVSELLKTLGAMTPEERKERGPAHQRPADRVQRRARRAPRGARGGRPRGAPRRRARRRDAAGARGAARRAAASIRSAR